MSHDALNVGDKMLQVKHKFSCGCRFNTLDFDNIPLDCAATWDLINSGFTRGIFQLEGSLGKKYSKELKPRNIDELSDVISLIRPGCLEAQYREKEDKPGKYFSITETYQEVKQERLKPEYIHPVLEPIFAATCGVPVYQEQIMRICTDFAGFSLEEADKARKAVGKKKADVMAKVKTMFLEGAAARGHDKDIAEEVFGWIEKFSGYGFNKCVSGDTVLNRGTANQYSDGLYTVGHLYRLVNDYEYAKSCAQIPLRKKLRSKGYGSCMAVGPDGRIRPAPIKTIHFNGPKKIYAVTDNGGRTIHCTIDHKFMCPDGQMRPIGEIGIGGQVVCHIDCYDDEYIYDYCVHRNKERGNLNGLSDITGRKNWAIIDGNWAAFEAVKKKYQYITYCQICLNYPDRLEWHHIDGDRSNNCGDNLIKLCVSCHKKEDYKLGRNRRYDKGHRTGIATITSIEYIKVDYTYDVEMDTPEHNWVADGFVVSNSHGVSYAMIGYQTAYAKRHFPLEYFKAKLTHSEDKQDTNDEVKALVHEARLFDIEIKPPCLKLLNINFAIQDDKSIAFGLVHIKGIGKTSVASLKRIAKFDHADLLLLRSFVKGSKVKKNVMEALIKSGALDYLGTHRVDLLVRYKILSALTERELGLLEEGFFVRGGSDIIKGVGLMLRSEEKGKKMTKPRVIKVKELITQVSKDLDGNKKRACIGYEKHYLGIPLTGSELELHNSPRAGLRCRDMHKLRDGTEGALAVIIEKVKRIKDKNKNHMCFMTVSDDTYMMECVVFSSTYKHYSWIIEEGKAVLLLGKKDGESFIVRKIEHL